MRLSNAVFVARSLLFAESALAEYRSCSLLGPDISIPRYLSSSTVFQDALVSLKKAISDAISSGVTSYGDVDANATSFSLDIFSIHEDDALFTYHYNAPGPADSTDGVREVDSNGIYRLGSISKLLTVYTFLTTVGDVSFNEPITKYVPELLGGIPREVAGSPASDALLLASLPPGVPAPIFSPVPRNITDAECPNNNAIPYKRAGVLGSINFQHPSFAPYWGPAYSNMAYVLLRYALEEMTNQSFPSLFASKVTGPLQLKDTYYSNAPLSQGVVPHNDSAAQYTDDLMDAAPAGGFYSSTKDMRPIGKAILSSTLLSPAQTRRWMKPQTFAANDAMLVGRPWEIYKAPLPEKSVWMYTKGGDIGLYSAQIVLLPDYGIGFNFLGAGDKPNALNAVVTDIVAAITVPASEQAAKEEAARVYAGTYMRPGSNDTFVLTVDASPGLLISRFLINGTDVVAGFGAQGDQIRMFPSGLQSRSG
ncbi:hypothetical protein McanCB21832_007471 [Microsporum canis]